MFVPDLIELLTIRDFSSASRMMALNILSQQQQENSTWPHLDS